MRTATLLAVLVLSIFCPAIGAQEPATRPTTVPAEVMKSVYEQVKTPFKYGIVIRDKNPVDCPSVFRREGKWYMVYIRHIGVGYETLLAESDNLLDWKPLGTILGHREKAWDGKQSAGYIALQDTEFGGSAELKAFDGKYWMSYLGNDLPGYEPDPLSIGMAWTLAPQKPQEWNRLDKPVMQPEDPDTRLFEKRTLYKSNIIHDPDKSLGWPFVMYYNGKSAQGIERIGMAVSSDMTHWKRFGPGPVLDHGSGITGDPQIVRIDKVWVMFYFGAWWRPKAFDRFACSYDLLNWTDWTGDDLIAPSEPWDQEYAHKPWVIRHEGVVYHFYCATGRDGRCIAVATSKDLKK